MTLHEAMIVVLKEKTMSLHPKEIADTINRRELYHRKDRLPLSAGQIRARVGRYPHLFEKTKDSPALIKLR